MSKSSQIVAFFSLHRQIFGTCPRPGCGEVFRLSDCHPYLRKRPVNDWLDALEQMDERLATLEEKLEDKAEEIRTEARKRGRRLAQKAVRRIDPIFTPRKLNPDDAKLLFHPIDYVVFNGMKERGQITSVILLDRQGTTSEQLQLQDSIQETVEKGRLDWETLRVGNDGSITVE